MEELGVRTEEKLSLIKERLDLLFARVESFDTNQQQLMARMEITTKAMEQRAKDHQLLAKQMEATTQAVARLTAHQVLEVRDYKDLDGLMHLPADVQEGADTQSCICDVLYGSAEFGTVRHKVEMDFNRTGSDNCVSKDTATDQSGVKLQELDPIEVIQTESGTRKICGDSSHESVDVEQLDICIKDTILPHIRSRLGEDSEFSPNPRILLLEGINFSSNAHELDLEEPPSIGHGDLVGHNSILQWAKAKEYGSLQVVCQYDQSHCPARGSSLTFHPLEHLHPWRFHRPSEIALHFTRSTIDLRSCDASLEVVEMCNALFAEEESTALLWLLKHGSDSGKLTILYIEFFVQWDPGIKCFLSEIPKKLVIGAGYIGLEKGSVWNRLGSEVTIAELQRPWDPGGITCIPPGWTNYLLPCQKMEDQAEHCQNREKIPLLSLEVLHQLHIFIFVLAIAQVIFSVSTMLLGGARIRQWKHWEDEIQKDDVGNGSRKVTQVHQFEFIRERFKGWAEKDANPALFSRELMENSSTFLKDEDVNHDPQILLMKAHAETSSLDLQQ